MNSRVTTGVVAGLALAAAAYGAHAQALAAAALREQAGAAAPALADYRIGPQDTLEIDVFQLSDLNRTVQVDSGGRVVLPLIGAVQASGKTADELSADIAARLGKTYVNNPQVTVFVKDAQGQRITVDGAVGQPGVYALTGPTTLMQAVALAKGPDTHIANLHRVTVFRMVDGQRVAASYDLAEIRSGKKPDPAVLGKDVIVVDTSQGRSYLRDLGQAVPVLSVLRWGW